MRGDGSGTVTVEDELISIVTCDYATVSVDSTEVVSETIVGEGSLVEDNNASCGMSDR